MANGAEHPFSDKSVCMALVRHGLITKAQAIEIFEKTRKIKENIEKQKERRSAAIPMGVKIINPTTIVDVIVPLNSTGRPAGPGAGRGRHLPGAGRILGKILPEDRSPQAGFESRHHHHSP